MSFWTARFLKTGLAINLVVVLLYVLHVYEWLGNVDSKLPQGGGRPAMAATVKRSIIRLLERGRTAYEVAAQYSCSVTTVHRVYTKAGGRYLACTRSLDLTEKHKKRRLAL